VPTLRQVFLTVLPFVLAVAVTAVFTIGVPLGDDTSGEIETEADGVGYIPAPSGDFDTDGQPPDGWNDFSTFEERSEALGFNYTMTYRGRSMMTSAGVYVVDFNNNGYEDVLAVGGESPVLFENVGGKFEQARTFEHSDIRSAHFFDYNNNGYRDLLLAQYGGELILYENTGGVYERSDIDFGKRVQNPSVITTADFTGNGYLDVFVGQNGHWQSNSPMDIKQQRRVFNAHPHVRPESNPANPNLLFQGDGETFTEITERAGIRGSNWTLAVSAADFTSNGYPDIHVGNDFGADIIYGNNGNGTFRRRTMGTASDRHAMASAVQDVTGNHHLDIFVTNIYVPPTAEMTAAPYDLATIVAVPKGNNLFVNDGTGEFTDEAEEKSVRKGGWGWAATIADYTNDGHLDIVHGASANIPVGEYEEYEYIQLFKGKPDGWERANSSDHGIEHDSTRGIARIDAAIDGRLDIVASAASWHHRAEIESSSYKLYRNTHEADESLQLFIRDPNGVERHAAVYVETDRRVIRRTVNARSGFNSQDSQLVHIGTANETVRSVTVLWPDGSTAEYDSLEEGNRYILTPSGSERVT